ncbi:MAG: sulfatase [Fuerstiella sp.]|nr:sulfatase [Fuerstiella sp.]MCP4854587.1 sulfatase [Fuerstiella sp.]
MRRRDFIQTTTGAATGAALAPTLAHAGETAERKPNLLIIHCDELNFRTLGCYRDTLPPEQAFMWGPNAYVETPHIDSIAREGTLCTKFYAATPVCSPSRSSFISGMYPHHTPVTTNNVRLSDKVVSFAQILGEQGYSTGYSGKWHLDGDGKPQWGPERNFGFQDNRYMFNRGHWKQLELTENGPRVKARDRKGQPSYSVEGADDESFTTDWLTNRAIEFIDEHEDSPFCYMLSIPDPHGPDTVRAPYDTMYDDTIVEAPRTFGKPTEGVPSWAMPTKNCNYRMANYHGMVKCVDDSVGRLIEALHARDLLDNTILVFTADHGDMRGEHGRQNKGIPLEASAKVPFVVRYPKSVPAGARIEEVLNTVDFLPSMLSLMGVIDKADHVHGRDASRLLRTGTAPQDWNDITFMRSTGKPGSTFGWVSALTPRFKLILSSADDPWLLDLQTDPDELINFIDSPEHKDVVQHLARELKDYGKRLSDPYTTNPKTSAWIEKLMA